MIQRYDNVLCFSDTHFPYHHPDTFEFLSAVKSKYQPGYNVHGGDITDSYAFSRYPKDPEYDECYTVEFQSVRESVQKLFIIFEQLDLVNSNHDSRLWDRAITAGIPRSVLLPFMEVIGARAFPEWRLVDDLLLDIGGQDWYFAHYKGANIMRVASDAGVSVVQGHTHTKFSINSATSLKGRIYGVETGCLIGDDRHAFAYNKASLIRPNLGCVMIERGVPRLIPMNLTQGGAWDGRC